MNYIFVLIARLFINLIKNLSIEWLIGSFKIKIIKLSNIKAKVS